MAPGPLLVDFRSVSDFSRKQLKVFDCDNPEMNDYLRRGRATANHKSDLSPCLIIVPKGKDEPIFGYVSVSNASIEKGEPPAPSFAHLPNYPVSVTMIGRLAVSKDYQGKGLGRRLLMHVFFTQYLAVRENHVGSVGVISDAIDEKAVTFYQKNGFEVLPGDSGFPKRMFIPNATIFDAIE